jgi:hypothetical protein
VVHVEWLQGAEPSARRLATVAALSTHKSSQPVLQQLGSSAQTLVTAGLHPFMSAAPVVETEWLQAHAWLFATLWTSATQASSHSVLQQ